MRDTIFTVKQNRETIGISTVSAFRVIHIAKEKTKQKTP
jgi:hypothetical protein